MAVILAALQLVLMGYAPVRRRSCDPAPAVSLEEPSGFDALLPLPLRGTTIFALQAEDHYVRVYTSAGAALVRMRFGDALELVKDESGVRPHRSWWVRRASVQAMHRKGERTELILRGGQQVPVSRSARAALGPLFNGVSPPSER